LEDIFKRGFSLGVLDTSLPVAPKLFLGYKGEWERIMDVEEVTEVSSRGLSIH